MSNRAAERALDALYAELPSIDCKGACQESCGPVLMSRVEWARITNRPDVGDVRKLKPGLTCPLLAPNGRCRAYTVRPMICRLWGVVESMPCPWGCRPVTYLTDEQGGEFLRRAAGAGA